MKKRSQAARRMSVGAIAEGLKLQLDFVIDVAQELGLPVLGHRDIVTADDAVRLAERCRTNHRAIFTGQPSFRWSFRKLELETRGLYDDIASRAAERIALARRCELRRGVDAMGRTFVEVRREDARVRLGRDFVDSAPKLITGFSDCVTNATMTSRRFLEVARGVGSVVAIDVRMRQVDELLEAADGR